MANDIRIEVGEWSRLGEHAAAVRVTVFVEEQGISRDDEWDEWDARAVHCVAYIDGEPIGTGRLLPDARIGRMAVLPAMRGRGVGAGILGRLLETGRERGERRFELSAQAPVVEFYRRAGFVPVGDAYTEVGIPHQRMILDDDAPPTGHGIVATDSRVTRPDGCGLHVRDWVPAQAPAGRGVYLFHGLGEHSGRYEHVARWLCERGWRVRGHDHRGHGQSDGARGALTRSSDLLDDGLAQIDQFSRDLGAAPVLIGHSMGGALAAQTVLVARAKVRGLVLSSPALDPGLSNGQIRLLSLLKAIAPNLGVSNGLDASKVSRDADVVAAYRSDPLVHAKVTARLIAWLLEAGEQATVAAPTMSIDTLLLVAGADELVRPEGSRRFANRAPRERLTLRWFEGYYHELFNEPAAQRQRVMADLDAWLQRFD
jgi:alpha-beta hydrolase superfamily lysophospholipase/predicted GNAT family N-acyltransferase